MGLNSVRLICCVVELLLGLLVVWFNDCGSGFLWGLVFVGFGFLGLNSAGLYFCGFEFWWGLIVVGLGCCMVGVFMRGLILVGLNSGWV